MSGYTPTRRSCVWRFVQGYLRKLRSGHHRVASSLFVLGELLVLPTRKRNLFALKSYGRMFSSPELTVLPYSEAATRRYAELRATQRVKPLDALHLATAAAVGAHLFITQDTPILSLPATGIPGIGQICDLSVKIT